MGILDSRGTHKAALKRVTPRRNATEIRVYLETDDLQPLLDD
jgi:hypothetical protein